MEKINNKIKILIIILVIILSVVAYVYMNNSNNSNFENKFEEIYIDSNEDSQNNEALSREEEIEKIKIHIVGEINNPGIYEISLGARIQDAITAAGGQTEKADLNKVNLAYEIEDGQKIYIPSIFDKETTYIDNSSGENVIINENVSSRKIQKININKASVEDLEKINGVGPSLAGKIISYREENGKFKTVEDLKNVSGIGEKKYEMLKEFVSI